MRKADLEKNHRKLDEAVKRYRSLMKVVLESEIAELGKKDKEDIAESLILRLTANWERFLDRQLVSCVNVDHSRLSEYLGVSIPKNPSMDLCQGLLFSDNYKDFKSCGDLKGYSKKILSETSNPFTQINSARTAKIDEMYKIRNYLAHYSSTAQRSLKKMYEAKYDLANFKEPGNFLLANKGERLWSYFDAIEGASRDMKNWYKIN